MNRPDTDLYTVAAPKAHGRSVILMHHGTPLTVGLLAGSVDLQVVHPRATTIAGRPDWLVGMHRTPMSIPRSLLPKSGDRLIQAFVQGEADDAIPVDQVMVVAGHVAPKLMLPSIPVRYAVQQRN